MANMSQEDYTKLKTDMHAPANQAALGAWLAVEDWVAISQWYNQSSGSTIWRPAVAVSEMNAVQGLGVAFDALVATKQQGYMALTQGGVCDATAQGVRSWFQDIFGTGAVLNALTQLAQKPGSRFEILFSTPAAPSNVTAKFGDALTAYDCQQAELHG